MSLWKTPRDNQSEVFWRYGDSKRNPRWHSFLSFTFYHSYFWNTLFWRIAIWKEVFLRWRIAGMSACFFSRLAKALCQSSNLPEPVRSVKHACVTSWNRKRPWEQQRQTALILDYVDVTWRLRHMGNAHICYPKVLRHIFPSSAGSKHTNQLGQNLFGTQNSSTLLLSTLEQIETFLI